jgi:hypothetical protein
MLLVGWRESTCRVKSQVVGSIHHSTAVGATAMTRARSYRASGAAGAAWRRVG